MGQQNSGVGKIIATFTMLTAFVVLGILSVVFYNKKPTEEEISEYVQAHSVTIMEESPAPVGREQEVNDTESITTEKVEITETTTEEAVTEAPVFVGNELLPEGCTLRADASLADISGSYEGEMKYVEISGYETMEEAPDNIKEKVAAEMAETHPITLTIDPDGGWEYAVDSEMGLSMDDRDMSDPTDEENGLTGIELIKNPENGYFKVEREVSEEEGEAYMRVDGTAFSDSEGDMINGSVEMKMQMGSQHVTIHFIYNARYVGEAD